jgi:hypothetical protein
MEIGTGDAEDLVETVVPAQTPAGFLEILEILARRSPISDRVNVLNLRDY